MGSPELLDSGMSTIYLDAKFFLDLAIGWPLQAGSYSFVPVILLSIFVFSGKKKKSCALPTPLIETAIPLRNSGSF